MRLTEIEKSSIKHIAQDVFGDSVKVILFGSRVDDNKKGGDIDLYLLTSPLLSSQERFEKKIRFLVDLKMAIGEQKIDVLMAKDSSLPIEIEALKSGVEL